MEPETIRIFALCYFMAVGLVFGFCFGYEAGRKVGRREASK
jgi:hypothetical protein